jgi:putative addiction module CopG family antidote
MPTSRQLVVNLPPNLADLVQRKVASGEYADESDVISDSLSLLEERESGLDRWLIEEVGPSYDAMHADPTIGIPIEQVQQDFAARRKAQGDSTK